MVRCLFTGDQALSQQAQRRNSLRHLEANLALSQKQLVAWRTFEEAFYVARRAIEASEEIIGEEALDYRCSLVQMFEMQSRHLAVRLAAARLLAKSTETLLAQLTHRQRMSAQRYLRREQAWLTSNNPIRRAVEIDKRTEQDAALRGESGAADRGEGIFRSMAPDSSNRRKIEAAT